MTKDNAAIIGVGCTVNPGEPHIESGFKKMIVEASYAAIDNAGIKPTDIEGASFSYTGEGEVGYGGITPTLVDALGLSPIPAFINSANCASGHAAFLQGCDMIETGRYKNVLVAGFGKMTDVIPFENYMLMSSDCLYDYNLGYSHIDSFLLGMEYFRKNDIPVTQIKQSLLKVAMESRDYGSYNPESKYYGKNLSTELLKKLPLSGCTLSSGEGASAIILSRDSYVSNKTYVVVSGRSLVSTSHYVGHRYDASLIEKNSLDVADMSDGLPLKIACDNAYSEAKVCASDIDTVQVYDQIINQFISLEAAGICSKGTAPQFYLNGETAIDGKCPVNTDGGNIARGFASGSAGLYSIIELYRQLTGQAKGKKISHEIQTALSTFIGGYYADAVAVILSKKGID